MVRLPSPLVMRTEPGICTRMGTQAHRFAWKHRFLFPARGQDAGGWNLREEPPPTALLSLPGSLGEPLDLSVMRQCSKSAPCCTKATGHPRLLITENVARAAEYLGCHLMLIDLNGSIHTWLRATTLGSGGWSAVGLASLWADLSPCLTVCDRRPFSFLWSSVSPLRNWDNEAITSYGCGEGSMRPMSCPGWGGL